MPSTRVSALLTAIKKLSDPAVKARIRVVPCEEDVSHWKVFCSYPSNTPDDATTLITELDVVFNVDGNQATLPKVSVVSPRLVAPFIHSGAICMVDFGQDAFDANDPDRIVLLLEQLHFRLAPDAVQGYGGGGGSERRYTELERSSGFVSIDKAHPEFKQATDAASFDAVTASGTLSIDARCSTTATSSASWDLIEVVSRQGLVAYQTQPHHRLEVVVGMNLVGALSTLLSKTNCSPTSTTCAPTRTAAASETLLPTPVAEPSTTGTNVTNAEQYVSFTTVVIDSREVVDLSGLVVSGRCGLWIKPLSATEPLRVKGDIKVDKGGLCIEGAVLLRASIAASSKSLLALLDCDTAEDSSDQQPSQACPLIYTTASRGLVDHVSGHFHVTVEGGGEVCVSSCALYFLQSNAALSKTSRGVVEVCGPSSVLSVADSSIKSFSEKVSALAVSESAQAIVSNTELVADDVGLIVRRSASLVMSRSSVVASKTGVLGLFGAIMDIHGLKLTGSAGPDNDSSQGLQITSRCKLNLRDCDVSLFKFGVLVEEASLLDATSVHVAGSTNAFTVSQSSSALTDCSALNAKQVGVFSVDSSRVVVKRFTVNSEVNGLEIRSATLSISESSIHVSGPKGFGVLGELASKVECINTKVSGAGNGPRSADGICVSSKSSLVVKDCSVSNTNFAFSANGKSDVRLVNCTIDGAINGVTVADSSAFINDCRISDTQGVGIFACLGGRIEVTGGSVASRRRAVESDDKSEITAHRVESRVENPLTVESTTCYRLSGNVKMFNCLGIISGGAEFPTFGVEVLSGNVALHECEIRGFDQGLTVGVDGNVSVTRSAFLGCRVTAIAAVARRARVVVDGGVTRVTCASAAVDCAEGASVVAHGLDITMDEALRRPLTSSLCVGLFARSGGLIDVKHSTIRGPGRGTSSAVITQRPESRVCLQSTNIENFSVVCMGEGGQFWRDASTTVVQCPTDIRGVVIMLDAAPRAS